MASSLFAHWGSLSPAQQAEILATEPGLTPPAGVSPDFNNPPNRNYIAIPVVTIFLTMVIVLGVLRLYSRIVMRTFKLEDYLGFLSYLPYLALTGLLIQIIHKLGFMVDQWNVSLGDVFTYSMVRISSTKSRLRLGSMLTAILTSQYLEVFRLLYAFFMLFAKSAILLEWKNIFVPHGTRNWFFWATMIMLGVNITTYTVAIFLTCFRCIPIWKIWQPWVDGHCFSQKPTDVATTFNNLAVDVVVLVLPQPIIWKLNMTRSRKVGVSVVFSMGLFAVTCAIGRVHSNLVLNYLGNTTVQGMANVLWSFGEATWVLMVFVAPGITRAFSSPFFADLIHTLRSWTRLGDGTKESTNRTPGQSGGDPWKHTIGSSRGKMRKPTATELALMDTRDMDGSLARPMNSESRMGNNEIWKTTWFESQEDSTSQASTQRIIGQQHPWMK
ncbi:hypothetical protein GGR56DRAFT_49640 [Xylariaceae sp. FL0804]|nr:hypothetical protein GGR56DRAFT_49640 [Xylariaceae sp. FL0804]